MMFEQAVLKKRKAQRDRLTAELTQLRGSCSRGTLFQVAQPLVVTGSQKNIALEHALRGTSKRKIS